MSDKTRKQAPLRAALAGFAVLAGLWAALPAQAQTLFRPVAIVNDSAITGYDLAQRAQILVALGFTAANADSLRAEALDQLVEDRLKLQAAEEIGISATPEQVDLGIQALAQRSDVSANEFRVLLSSQGVSEMALNDLARAEVLWSQVVRARFANRVQPGEAEIDAEIGLLEQRGAFQYRVAEIGLPLTADGRTEAETRALAEQLYAALNQGGDFQRAVAEYSRSPSAAQGGNVGWVNTQRMPVEVLRELSGLQDGQITRPMAVPGGLSLLKLLERRQTNASGAGDTQLRARVRERLIQSKSGRLAEGLLQEMRRDALIQVR
ncbi:MAG: peptidylprolyl isomerase [Pseudomonadota bacterium]